MPGWFFFCQQALFGKAGTAEALSMKDELRRLTYPITTGLAFHVCELVSKSGSFQC